MPAPAKTSDQAIVAAARRLVERDGAEALSMQAVAQAIGIKAPSLYKRFSDRAALLFAVEEEALAELGAAIGRAARFTSPRENLRAMARAYRKLARAHPRLYGLLFSGATRADPEATAARRRVVEPLLVEVAALVGSGRALAAARVLTAFLHGFVSMENAGEFRLGPGVDQAFELGLSLLI